MSETKSKLFLYGTLAEKFGKEHEFAVDSLPDCISMLTTQFETAEIRNEFLKYNYEIIKNDEHLDNDNFMFHYEGYNVYHVIPVIEGSGSSKGTFQIILGAALIALAIWNPAFLTIGKLALANTIFSFGVGLFLTGIGSMLAPSPETNYADMNRADKPSYVFSGAINSTEQGAVAPLPYGRFLWPSVVINSELTNEDI